MAIKWTGIKGTTAYSAANQQTQGDYVPGMHESLYVTGPGYGSYEAIVRLHDASGAVVASVVVSSGGGSISAPPPVKFIDTNLVYSYSVDVVRGEIPQSDETGILIQLYGGSAERYPVGSPTGDGGPQGGFIGTWDLEADVPTDGVLPGSIASTRDGKVLVAQAVV